MVSYKYPDGSSEKGKLARFFGDDPLAASIANRLNNEYSHRSGLFEKAVLPIDVPEMQRIATFILRKVEENDSDQYGALLQSIGVNGR